MTFRRLWLYKAACLHASCRASVVIESAGIERPTPAQWAQKELRDLGWAVLSRGNRGGWNAYCPNHDPRRRS